MNWLHHTAALPIRLERVKAIFSFSEQVVDRKWSLRSTLKESYSSHFPEKGGTFASLRVDIAGAGGAGVVRKGGDTGSVGTGGGLGVLSHCGGGGLGVLGGGNGGLGAMGVRLGLLCDDELEL